MSPRRPSPSAARGSESSVWSRSSTRQRCPPSRVSSGGGGIRRAGSVYCSGTGSGAQRTKRFAGRCTASRIACVAVVMLVLLGDSTSVGSSQQSSSTLWRGTRPSRRVRTANGEEPSTAFIPPSTVSSRRVCGDNVNAVGGARVSLIPRKASLGAVIEARRARKQSKSVGNSAPTAVAGDSNSGSRGFPAAHLFSVSRQAVAQGAQRVLSSPEGGKGGVLGRGLEGGLQSPRFAAAGEGRSYPERLQVSAQPIVEGSAAAAPGARGSDSGFVSEGGEGRPQLPELTAEELTQLEAGQRVQKQTRQGGAGSGSVVVDVRADRDVVLGLLTKYDDYATMIDTVRQCEVFPSDSETVRKVEVTVSRFRLHIRVLMTLITEENMVRFELDPDCTKAGRAVLREATGYFYVESPPDRPGYSRVWMFAKVDVNRFVPGAIVDYAASRALPRASNWIKPTCEMAQRRKVRAGMGKDVAAQ